MTNLRRKELYDFLKKEGANCNYCELSKTRTNTVWGEGDEQSDILFLGQCPGEEEDKLGRPFVGKSGKLLRTTLIEVGFDLEKCYIMNCIMCNPPKNRNPSLNEIESCHKWFKLKIKYYNPKLVVAIGKFSLSKLLNKPLEEIKIGKEVCKILFCDYAHYVIPIFHPSFILRTNKKEEFQNQIKFIYDKAIQLKLKGIS